MTCQSILPNPRRNPAELFFANLKAKENEEKAAENEGNARKLAKKALELAKIAKKNEEQARSHKTMADIYAEEQKLSIK